MHLKVGIENFNFDLYKIFTKELMRFSDCLVTQKGQDVEVEVTGDIVQRMCVVAICDKYRFGRYLEVSHENEFYDSHEQT